MPVDLAITGIVDEVDMEEGVRLHRPTAIWHIVDSVSSSVGAEED